MARLFKIVRVLRPETLRRYEAIQADGRKTINELRRWLADHGCAVCRGAVFNYRRYSRRHAIPVFEWGGRSERELRELIRQAAGQLQGRYLEQLAIVAAALRGLSKAR